jgi:hypothetical protein
MTNLSEDERRIQRALLTVDSPEGAAARHEWEIRQLKGRPAGWYRGYWGTESGYHVGSMFWPSPQEPVSTDRNTKPESLQWLSGRSLVKWWDGTHLLEN